MGICSCKKQKNSQQAKYVNLQPQQQQQSQNEQKYQITNQEQQFEPVKDVVVVAVTEPKPTQPEAVQNFDDEIFVNDIMQSFDELNQLFNQMAQEFDSISQYLQSMSGYQEQQ